MKTLFLTATDGTKRPILIAGSAVVVPVETPAEPPPFDAESAGLPYRTEFTFKTIADAERGIRYKNRSYICMVEGAPMRVVPSGTGHGLATCSAAEDGSFERAVVVFVAEKRNEWQATHNASTARAALRVAGGANSNLFLDLTVRETVEEIGRMLSGNSGANPTESDIAERVRLLRKSAQGLRKPSAASDGCSGLCSWGGCFWVLDLTSSPIWKEVGVELWPVEVERAAIRQLLAERAK